MGVELYQDPLDRAEGPADRPGELPPARPWASYLGRGCLIGLLILALTWLLTWLLWAPAWLPRLW